MATLIENVERIQSATSDIRNWIVDKGQIPTGGIDTFRSALDGIEINKVKAGEFTSNTAGVSVNCGFAPKVVFVSNNYKATTYNELDAWINGSFSGARGSGGSTGGNITTPTITVSGNSFTHKAYTTNFAGKPAYYIAMG